ncbi:MAG: ATP-binding cassette domain-containing protein, partial [Stackebrandtia sp.]
GYIGQGNGAGHSHKVRDELINQGRFYGLSGSDSRQRADRLLVDLNLSELAKRAVVTLSGGQRRRLDIAMGMVHRPELLFLDEPSTGLDPQNRANLAERIRELRDQHGTTIFLTTHYLDEADQLAERVLIIDGGRIIAEGAPAKLKAELAGDRVTVGCATGAETQTAAAVARRLDTARDVTVDGLSVCVTAPDGESLLPHYLRLLDASAVDVRTARLAVPTLDDVFLALTGRSLRDADN